MICKEYFAVSLDKFSGHNVKDTIGGKASTISLCFPSLGHFSPLMILTLTATFSRIPIPSSTTTQQDSAKKWTDVFLSWINSTTTMQQILPHSKSFSTKGIPTLYSIKEDILIWNVYYFHENKTFTLKNLGSPDIGLNYLCLHMLSSNTSQPLPTGSRSTEGSLPNVGRQCQKHTANEPNLHICFTEMSRRYSQRAFAPWHR